MSMYRLRSDEGRWIHSQARSLQAEVAQRLRVLALAVLSVAAADDPRAGEWYVDDDGDCRGADGSHGAPFCTIEEAVRVALDGDTIHVAAGRYPEILVVDKDVTILGTGGDAVTEVDGAGLGTVISVCPSTNLTVCGLTLRGGHLGIEVDFDAALVARNCTFSDNRFGGGIFNRGFLVLERCMIRDNSSASWECHDGGGGILNMGSAQLANCTLRGNSALRAQGGGICNFGTMTLTSTTVCANWADCRGGGIANHGTMTLIDSTTAGNACIPIGGGIFNDGEITLHGSRVQANQSVDLSSGGGGLATAGTATLVGSTLSQNTSWSGSAILVFGNSHVEMSSCTIAGNRSRSSGGGVAVEASSTVVLDHTIVADNEAPTASDCIGVLESAGYNLISDTSGCTITGDPTGNLLDVDPLFEALSRDPIDPCEGVDYTLRVDSPCVDTGNPDLIPGGRDLLGSARLLDGDLDRAMVVDIGAYEFANVHIAVTGDATPGGRLTMTSTGTTGLDILLLVGTASAEVPLHPYGTLFVDLSAPWLVLAWGTIPSSVNASLPGSVLPGTQVVLQGLAIDGTGPQGGNTSNAAELVIE